MPLDIQAYKDISNRGTGQLALNTMANGPRITSAETRGVGFLARLFNTSSSKAVNNEIRADFHRAMVREYGREIANAPSVLLTAYATRGLDINSSYLIYDTINAQKMRGVAVLYVGEDLDVLLELSDRILVLCGGRVSGIVPGRGAKKRDVGMMMTKLGGNAHE